MDSSQITSLVSVGKGYFATASTAGTIKVWEPLKVSPIATISEDSCSIDFLVPIIRNNNVNIIYVCQSKLKCFNVKTMRAITLLENGENTITAICQNQQRQNVLSLGLSNGQIKDFDLQKRSVIRSPNLHQGERVVAIMSRNKHLVSASQDGRTIVYDYAKL